MVSVYPYYPGILTFRVPAGFRENHYTAVLNLVHIFFENDQEQPNHNITFKNPTYLESLDKFYFNVVNSLFYSFLRKKYYLKI